MARPHKTPVAPTTSVAAPAQLPRGFKISELARQYPFLGKSKIRKIIATGELPARWCGGLLIVFADDIERYLAGLPVFIPRDHVGAEFGLSDTSSTPAAKQKARRA